MAYKVFTNGSVLNASEINDNLMNQSVMVFSNSTARAAALTAPVEGMLTWLQDTNKYENYNGTAWVALGSGVLKVLQTVKTDTFTTSSTSFTDVTGMSVSITPSSTASKILVMVDAKVNGRAAVVMAQLKLLRDSTDIYIGDADGSRTRAGAATLGDSEFIDSTSMIFLDSPSTTSSITYKIQMRANTANAIYLNRAHLDTNDAARARTASSITLMEVSG